MTVAATTPGFVNPVYHHMWKIDWLRATHPKALRAAYHLSNHMDRPGVYTWVDQGAVVQSV